MSANHTADISSLNYSEASFALLADIFPTGWHGLTLSHFSPGESVAVFGAGPVGLMAAYSASLRGASRIFVVDRVPERLVTAEKIPGCEGINFGELKDGDAVEEMVKRNGGKMIDRSVDAVGYQATGGEKGEDGKEKEVPNVVLEQCIRVTRPTGGIGVPGLYVPSDPGAVDEKSAKGMMSLSFGKLFEKVCFFLRKSYPSMVGRRTHAWMLSCFCVIIFFG